MAASIECTLCYEDMVEPRTIPCGHPFCKACLQKLVDAADNLKCPLDNKLYGVPGGSADNLMRNYYLESVIDSAKRAATTTATRDDAEECHEHAGKTAKFFCESCIKPICSKCVLKHKAHDCFAYEECYKKSSDKIQSVKEKVGEYKATIDQCKREKLQTYEAKKTALLDETLSKISEIVKLLNLASEKLQIQANDAYQEAFDCTKLEKLLRNVGEIEGKAAFLGEGKLEVLVHQADALERDFDAFETEYGAVMAESYKGLNCLVVDRRISSSLSTVLTQARILNSNLANNTYRLLSLNDANDTASKTQEKLDESTTAFTNILHKLSKSQSVENSIKQILLLTGGKYSSKTFAYDPDKDAWCNAAAMSEKRWYAAAALLKGRLVVAGGYNDSTNKRMSSVEQYDPEANAWTALPSMQLSRDGLALVTVDNALFAIGGFDGKTKLNSVERFDAGSSKWTFVAPLTVARWALCAAHFQAGILVAGGASLQGKVANSCEFYSGAAKKWRLIAPLINARYMASAATANEKFYVCGGKNESFQFFDTLEEYDKTGDKWTVLQVRLSVPRYGSAVASVNDRVYICGGSNSASQTVVECFDASSACLASFASLPEALVGAAAASVHISAEAHKKHFCF